MYGTGQLIQTITFTCYVYKLELLSNGTGLLAIGCGTNILLWNTTTRNTVKTITTGLFIYRYVLFSFHFYALLMVGVLNEKNI